MRIGNIQLKNNILLAPMAGVTDRAYRIVCREMGCGLSYTEMVSAKGMHYKSKNTEALLELDDVEKPSAVQIFGSDADILSETAKIVEARGADIIDINMGCPAPKIVKNGDGSALMLKPKLVEEIVKKVSSSISIPLTVKIRKGWDDDNINAVEIALISENAGAKAVAVHGRTRQQFYSGKADWSIIKEVKRNLSIPVIGNGDVFEPEDAKRMLEETDCDGVMIGRCAEGNPWIFKRVEHYLSTGNIIDKPNYTDKIGMMKHHLRLAVRFKGENIGIKEMRKHVAWYLKGMPNSTEIKVKIFKIENTADMENILDEYLDKIINRE